MADKTGKDISFWIDNASAALTALTAHLNSVTLTGTQSTLQNTALNDDEHSFLPGIAGGSVSINGFWNSTTRGIFAPLIDNRTSVSKTVQLYDNIQYVYGESWVENIQLSGSVDSAATFSADIKLTGALNSTSVSQV